MALRKLIMNEQEYVVCQDCKYALPVDARHHRYYCTHPERKARIYYGEHCCKQGERK